MSSEKTISQAEEYELEAHEGLEKSGRFCLGRQQHYLILSGGTMTLIASSFQTPWFFSSTALNVPCIIPS